MAENGESKGRMRHASLRVGEYRDPEDSPITHLQTVYNNYQSKVRKLTDNTPKNKYVPFPSATDEDLRKIHEEMRGSELYTLALASSASQTSTITDMEIEYVIKSKEAKSATDDFHEKKARRTPFADFGRKDASSSTRNPLRGRIVGLLIVNCSLFFIYFGLLAQYRYAEQVNHYEELYNPAAASFNATAVWNEILIGNGALNANLMEATNEYWQIFWAMWLHTGWLHIGMNVLIQIQYFFIMEPDWGFFRIIFTYLFSGIVGNCISICMTPCTSTCGSSGALYGVLGSSIVHQMEYWNAIPRPLINIAFTFLVVPVSIMTSMQSGVDNWAHVGGFLTGSMIGLTMVSTLGFVKRRESPPQLPPTSKIEYFKQYWFGNYSTDWLEWVVRGVALTLLVTLVSVVGVFVSGRYDRPYTLGAMTWHGFDKCCCARFIEGFMCAPCDYDVKVKDGTQNIDDYMTACAKAADVDRGDVTKYECKEYYYNLQFVVNT